ncbi:endolytic transglycosylase MltG [Oscillospiraceae bacterium 50-16]|nr:endolytic transglycosylase MltG [Lawsonibacter sp.]
MSQERYYEDRDRRSPRPPEERERTAPRRRKKRQSSAGRTAALVLLYVVAVIGASILLACVGWVAAGDVLALNKPDKEVTITIAPDTSFDDVTNRLKEEGLIEYKLLFKLFAAFTHGADKVTMGTYTLNTDMDYRALLYGMSANSATKAEVSVTITEGMTTAQIFQELERMGVASRSELERVASEHDYAFSFLQDIPLGSASRLEGYLYPDTYTFNTPHSPLYAINKMLVRFDELFTNEMRQQVADSGNTIRQILTIASLIERETDGSDQRQIASVIYNRLNNPGAGTNGYLQIDATLVYINGGKEPTEADKAIDSPYNTYKYQGLPPGPIANPGMEAIKAAMNPESTNYYYYALGDDGSHHFFRTLQEQQSFIATQELYK